MASSMMTTMMPATAVRTPVQQPRCSSSFVAGSSSAFRAGSPVMRVASRSQQRQQPLRQVTRMGLFGLGVPEIALVAGAAALLFGPSKIPQLGQSLGKTAKSVKAAADEFQKELQSAEAEDGDKAASGTSQKLKNHPKAGEGEEVRDLE